MNFLYYILTLKTSQAARNLSQGNLEPLEMSGAAGGAGIQVV